MAPPPPGGDAGDAAAVSSKACIGELARFSSLIATMAAAMSELTRRCGGASARPPLRPAPLRPAPPTTVMLAAPPRSESPKSKRSPPPVFRIGR